MKTYYLLAGHQIIKGRGTGAHSVHGDEAVLAAKFRDDVAAKMLEINKNCVVRKDLPADPLNRVISWLVGHVDGDDIVVDFHFNSSSSTTATGTEMIIPEKYTKAELDFAQKFAHGTAICLRIPMRRGKLPIAGVKTEAETQHKSIGVLRRPYKAKNMLVELCFLSNGNDMKSFRHNYNSLVHFYATELLAS